MRTRGNLKLNLTLSLRPLMFTQGKLMQKEQALSRLKGLE